MLHPVPTAQVSYRKFLYGWLSYAFASEVFVIVSLTLFLPICLEQFARDNGFFLPDKTKPCSVNPAKPSADTALYDDTARCVVKLGWIWIDSASFSLYVNSISVALQAITVISMGGIANHPPYRKRVLLLFATLGSLSAILFLFLPSTSPIWLLSALLAILANVGFGASIVALNAYLPPLAQRSDVVVNALTALKEAQAIQSEDSTDADTRPSEDDPELDQPLLRTNDSEEAIALKSKYDNIVSRTTARLSSLGIALGYSAGILLLVVTLIPVTKLSGSTFSLRLAIGISGIWWAIFSIPAALLLPSNTGSSPSHTLTHKWSLGEEIVKAWKKLGDMLRWPEIKKLRNTFWYLAAWFLLSDGFTTITSTAVLFAKTSLKMPASSLTLIGIIAPSAGILGSLVWPMIQRRFSLSNVKVIMLLVVLVSLVPAYGCLGFLPIFGGEGGARFGGLTTPGEMYALTVYFGLLYGAFQGYARAFYAELIPPGDEARWYALFSITDKSSSFVGPLIVGIIADLTGNIRYAFFFLIFMIWLALPLLSRIDVEKGRTDAQRY